MADKDFQNKPAQQLADYPSLLQDVKQIVEQARQHAYTAVNVALVHRNWLLGKRIREEELRGESRAEYGAKVIKRLSQDLTSLYGQGFTKTNLYSFTAFYDYFPEIFHSLRGKSNNLLTWTHYRVLLQVTTEREVTDTAPQHSGHLRESSCQRRRFPKIS